MIDVVPMAKSFRLNPKLQRRVELAAACEGLTASELIRDALRRRCDEVLGGTLLEELGDVVGAIEVGGDSALRTGQEFTIFIGKNRG